MKKNQILKNISDILIHNKRLLAALMVIFVAFFVMAYDLGVFAANVYNEGEVPNTASFTFDGTVAEHFNLSEPYGYISWENMISSYDGDPDNIRTDANSPFLSSASNFDSSILSPSNNYGYLVPSEVVANGVTYRINTGAYYLGTYSWASGDSQKWYFNYRFWSAGNIAFISCSGGNYVISDQPIQFMYTRAGAYWQGVIVAGGGEINEQDATGLYHYSLQWQPVNIPFTDMPVYLGSTDGGTGFTNYSSDTTDFSFSGDNYNFNNLIRNGVVVDPAAPQESEIEKVSKSYMNFYATDSYAGDALTMMYHNINFNPNDYMRLHGEQFQIVVQHECTYKGSDMDSAVNFTMPEQTVKVDMLLAKSPRGEFSIHLDLHDMKDSDGVDVRQYLLNTLHSPSGAGMPIYQENVNIFGDIGQALSDAVSDLTPLNLSRYTSSNLVVIGNQYNNFIDEFYITSKIFVRSAPPDYNYESGFNLTKYNVRSGEYSIEQNDGGTNLYPPADNPNTDGLPSVIPSGGSGGSVGVTVNSGGVNNSFSELANSVANAIIQSGAIQNTVSPTQSAYGGSIESGAVVVNAGGSQDGFQLSPGEWTEYGSFVESTANAMRETFSAGNQRRSGDSDNNFINVLKDVYSVFPPQFWVFTFAAVGTVTTVSIWKTARSH